METRRVPLCSQRRPATSPQEELADRADVNRNYVGMLEREEHAATIDMLEKLAAVLDVDPIEFFRKGRWAAQERLKGPKAFSDFGRTKEYLRTTSMQCRTKACVPCLSRCLILMSPALRRMLRS